MAVTVEFAATTARWLLLTLWHPWRLENVRHVMVELTALLQRSTARQSDPVTAVLRSAYQAVARGRLDAAEQLYDEAIRRNPHRAESHFLKAANLTYLRGIPVLMDGEFAEGLRANRLATTSLGLHALDLKILGDDFAGMGHLTLLDPLLKLKKLGLVTNRHLMVVQETSVANPAYLNYWRTHLPILVTNATNYSSIRDLFTPIFENVSMFEAKSGNLPLYEAWNLALNSWGDAPPLLQLTAEDREAGERVLEQAGIPRGSWFVGVHVREGEKGGHLRSGPDSDIVSYLPAFERVRERGGRVIRMGKGGTSIVETDGLWDYANSGVRSDWMDVYLWASCRFFIGTSSGPLSVPQTFGKPVLYTNATNMGMSPNFSRSLMIPKLFWSDAKKALLTFREMLNGPYGWTVLPSYDGGRTRLVPNSAAEIVSAVDEMLELLERPGTGSANTDMQHEFERLRAPYRRTSQARIADSFVRLHSDLLR